MERREAYRFFAIRIAASGQASGGFLGILGTRAYGRALFVRPAVPTGPFGPETRPTDDSGQSRYATG